jgi:adenosylcobinamide-phosphate synthase
MLILFSALSGHPLPITHHPPAARSAQMLLCALAIDALLGELPSAAHPVVWMGRWLGPGERLAPAGRAARLAWGAAWVAGGALAWGGLAAALPRWPLLRGAAASTLLAYRALDSAVGEVQAALAADDLAKARRLLSWHLVSRPTADLSAAEVAAAAIESLAENLSDSVVAPLLAGLLAGLPGMAIYRFVNTADAMWGYRSERYEWLGKPAARADDLLNLLPSRLTAALLALAAGLRGGRARNSLRVARRDHRRTASPNAGWPMAAMAGALDTVLTKREHYSLGDGPRQPDAAMLGEARQIARTAWAMLIIGLAAGSACEWLTDVPNSYTTKSTKSTKAGHV